MCGIAGWVDFAADPSTEGHVLRTMTDTMCCRGPDDEGSFIGPHVAFGHRRLAVIDLAGGRQPMVAERNGEPGAVLVYGGEVYNYRELRGQLQSHGHEFSTSSDTEVVLHAYLEWGADCVTHLDGMFAFAVWDGRSDELWLCRDRLGIKPLFYAPTAQGVVFGSEPKAIFAHPSFEPVLTADGLREVVTVGRRPGHAYFDGLHEVPAGAVVRLGRDGLDARCYWSLEARDHVDDLPTTIRTVTELLEDAVRRQLVSDVPLCTLLSGGVDSSTVTALAARHAGGVTTFAVRPAGADAAGHARGDPLRRTPDAPFIAQMAAWLSADHTDVEVSTAQLLEPAARGPVLRAFDAPVSRGDIDMALYLLFATIRDRCTVVLSGEGADELFGGYDWLHTPERPESRGFPWSRVLGSAHPAPLRLFDPHFVAGLDVGTFAADAYQDALAAVPHHPGDSPVERRHRQLSHIALTRFLRYLLDRKDRMSMASGIEARVPYCDHRLVEYVFNTPWSMKVFAGREKSLLRAASKNLLPRAVSERHKSAFPVIRDPAYEVALRSELAELLDTGDAPVLPYLDIAAARAVLKSPVDPIGRPASRFGLEYALYFNRWLVRYRPRLVL